MFKRIVIFIIGMFITSYSFMFYIMYLNLLRMGYSFNQYIKFVFSRVECLIILLGIILILISLKKYKKKV